MFSTYRYSHMQLKNDDQNVFQGLHFVNMFKKTIAFVIICD